MKKSQSIGFINKIGDEYVEYEIKAIKPGLVKISFLNSNKNILTFSVNVISKKNSKDIKTKKIKLLTHAKRNKKKKNLKKMTIQVMFSPFKIMKM